MHILSRITDRVPRRARVRMRSARLAHRCLRMGARVPAPVPSLAASAATWARRGRTPERRIGWRQRVRGALLLEVRLDALEDPQVGLIYEE